MWRFKLSGLERNTKQTGHWAFSFECVVKWFFMCETALPQILHIVNPLGSFSKNSLWDNSWLDDVWATPVNHKTYVLHSLFPPYSKKFKYKKIEISVIPAWVLDWLHAMHLEALSVHMHIIMLDVYWTELMVPGYPQIVQTYTVLTARSTIPPESNTMYMSGTSKKLLHTKNFLHRGKGQNLFNEWT